MTMVVDKIFIFLHFMYLLTVPIVKNSHTLAEIYFIFLKEHPRLNSNQIWTSKERLKK